MKSKYMVYKMNISTTKEREGVYDILYITGRKEEFAVRVGYGIQIFAKAWFGWNHIASCDTVLDYEERVECRVKELKEGIGRFLNDDNVAPVICGYMELKCYV